MRLLPVFTLSLAGILVTGCGAIEEVTGAAQKTQQCIEAAGIVTETVSKITSVASDPAAVEKALNDGATKLTTLADDAANTSLKEAADGVAAKLDGYNVQDANDAVDTLQKVATDSIAWVDTLTKACA
ncbi:hypothetical protein Acor_03380 [Acrocarpospora corrugata]|uniref:Lipoprotein n=1 Tax=Acrocarpospora corrugata TaxID=35763 RepID=A0A5M3VNB4_9ACTN|nr:hypothetical protein [Acrocarpospora corrugata]GER98276.1 hypothetical protein Acor_03380 [Acrocarpospora corrugata]